MLRRSLRHAIFFCTLFLGVQTVASAHGPVDALKARIISLAQSFEGQGDPDQSLQGQLDVLVEELTRLSQMPSAQARLPLIEGAWKQIWGPYDYRNDDGGVDPTLGVREIYQVVFREGYYYNVAPYFPNGDRSKEQISLLRGEFTLDSVNPNVLNVRFTDYPGVDKRPTDEPLWTLPVKAEAGTLENRIVIVPSDLVRRFFGGGSLEEIYTDHDLRILYGRKNPPSTRRFLYIMTRVN